MRRRSRLTRLADTLTFPVRALVLHYHDRGPLSSLQTERFDYVAREITGPCLDIGCGPGNRFVTEFLDGDGRGIDVFDYGGQVDAADILDNLRTFPCSDGSFRAVTFIACLNHVAPADRLTELREAYRCLEPGGRVVVTMGNPVAEVLVHKLVSLEYRLFKWRVDPDSERGMHEDEDYYVHDRVIRALLAEAGFQEIRRRTFGTQWGLNHLLTATRPDRSRDTPGRV